MDGLLSTPLATKERQVQLADLQFRLKTHELNSLQLEVRIQSANNQLKDLNLNLQDARHKLESIEGEPQSIEELISQKQLEVELYRINLAVENKEKEILITHADRGRNKTNIDATIKAIKSLQDSLSGKPEESKE